MFKCGRCDSAVSEGAQCCACQKHFDFACAGISEANYRKLGKNKSSWRCPECRSSVSSHSIKGTSSPSIDPTKGSVQEELQKIATRLLVLGTLSDDVKLIKSEIQHLKTSVELAHESIKNFTDKINKLEANVKKLDAQVAEVPVLRAEVDKLQQGFYQQEQWLRTNNIEIKGIPLRQNENLYTIAERIGRTLEYPIRKSDINFITRVPTRQKDSEKPIIISFLYKYQKEDLMVAARKHKDITASSIGYEGTNRVFINDHLTSHYKNLLLKAKTLKMQSDFQFLWVKNSKILARRSPGTPIFTINCEADLKKIK